MLYKATFFDESINAHLVSVGKMDAAPPVGRGGLVLRSRPRDRRAAGSKPDSTEDSPCMGPAARQITRSGQTPSRWCGAEVWRGGASSGVVLAI
ncbi:hypothetical protein AVEN_147249-1 [Araneus ventricosus]|uniref:Uncharacterized protein n=1 Tax=Araneus ventricosus TaxID=182803 RepID=A0A4Y2R278_ARAVE|nr:hypothetical protein AVEN_147249-1 [Araneus ventricosus]